MLVPYYGNKKNLTKTYENNDYIWVDLNKFLDVLNDKVLQDFEDLDGFNLEEETQKDIFKQKCSKYPPINIDGDNFVSFKEFIVSAKLLFMTGFTCKYGFWKKGGLNDLGNGEVYTHHGIDLILPKGTPIISFSSGEVVAAQYAKGYGNYVVIKSQIDGDNLYFCYEHLEEIKVQKGEKVKKNDIIGTCGSSGRAFGYHLHFQIDKDTGTFHPYWSYGKDDVEKTLQNCIDPWQFLRNYYLEKKDNLQSESITNSTKKDDFDIVGELVKEIDEKTETKLVSAKKKLDNGNNNGKIRKESRKNENIELIFPYKKKQNNSENLITTISQDLSKNSLSGNYIDFFINAGVLKGDKGDYLLKNYLTRYQMTLILYRLYKAGLLPIKDVKNSCNIRFTDIDQNLQNDKEFLKALDFVVCNSIITGDHNKFLPWNKLTGEQFLAITGRLFAGLKNSSGKKWYQTYYNWAIDKKLIDMSWPFIGDFITREEILKILYKLILS